VILNIAGRLFASGLYRAITIPFTEKEQA
jgi:hypothetical protein